MASTTPRAPLTRTRIAAAAVALGDREGVDALTMRRIGSELGVEAMSLYNHVANKEDLFDAIGDLLYSHVLEQYSPLPENHWRDDAWSMVRAYYDVVNAHPNIATIMLDRPIPGGVKVLFMHSCYQVFLKAGFSLEPATLAFNTVSSWLVGAMSSDSWLAELSELEPVDATDLAPELQDTVAFVNCCLQTTSEQRLRAGFETLMAGIEQQLSTS